MDRDQIYRDYMTIVFGLVATKGLEKLAERAASNELTWSQVPFFLGAFVIGVHYWYVCVAYAGESSATYKALSDSPTKKFWKNLSRITFFGVPVLFVSAYAGAVVMFFYAIPTRYDLLFRAFWLLLLASVINDVWDLVTTYSARRSAEEKGSFDNTLKLIWSWFRWEGIYLGVYFCFVNDRLVCLSTWRPGTAGLIFLGLAILAVVLDAIGTPTTA